MFCSYVRTIFRFACSSGIIFEVYERVEQSVISVSKRTLKKARKLSGVVIYFYLKDSAFAAVKRDSTL